MGRAAARSNATFVLSTGDNFYKYGVADLADPQWLSSFEAVYTAPALQVSWYAVLGNHGAPAPEGLRSVRLCRHLPPIPDGERSTGA